ncbi:peptide deformylase, mitochondrial [Drosophila busckii]|uniref:peptide deformylase, mitochondrial n=1 Tax=Drosophila busckii TaxID=30019 RepID=UPI00083EDA33|nr:peptide deformylase, mitochondrial [Drosophila busckii]
MSAKLVARTAPPYNHFTQIGDPVLRLQSEQVSSEQLDSKEIHDIVQQMVQVLRHYDCVGIAAPQIGVPLRIIAMEFHEGKRQQFTPEVYAQRKMSTLPLAVFINPTLELLGEEQNTHPEGCMSVRGYSAEVERYDRVRISGIGMLGTPSVLELSGWSARIAQHEMDHLNGIIYIDRMIVSSFMCNTWQKINEAGGCAAIEFQK